MRRNRFGCSGQTYPAMFPNIQQQNVGCAGTNQTTQNQMVNVMMYYFCMICMNIRLFYYMILIYYIF